jgi:hypothetical protein
MFESELINQSVTDILNGKELEELVNCFGSLMTMLSNKSISCVTFFILLIKYPSIRECLIELSDQEWYTIVSYMAYRYPILNKSKKIK